MKKNVIDNFNETTFEADHCYELFHDGTVKDITEEIPFDVPEGWEWTRLQSITSILTDGTHKTPTYSEDGFVFLSSKNVTSGKIDWDNIMYIPQNLHDELYSRLSPQMDDILLAKNGTTGVAAIVDRNCVFDIYVSLGLIRIVNKIILPKYILYAIGSTIVQEYFNGSLKGIGVPNLHLEHIRKTLIPIPPKNEQIFIVSKLEEILPCADEVNHQVEELKSSVYATKAKILDLAIRGKLVPQDPNDEPASVLLDRIRAEKEELIKQGKLKRDKKESIIYKGDDNCYYEKVGKEIRNIDEEIPFEIPSSWTWCRLNNIAGSELGKTLDKAKNSGKYHKYLRSINVKWGATDLSDLNEMKFEDNELERYSVKRHDLLICEGGDVGRSCVWETNHEMYYQNALHRVRFYQQITPYFYMYVMKYFSDIGKLDEICKGVTIKHLTRSTLLTLLFPLPPLEEQIQICNKIKEYNHYIDTIEISLK